MTIDIEDIQDAIKMGILPPPHAEEAQKVVSDGGEVTITSIGEVVTKFSNEADLNGYFIAMANGNPDAVRTDRIMRQEVTNLVSDMVANSPSEESFKVGGKKFAYRQIFVSEIENQKRLLFSNEDDRIVFGYNSDKPCTVIYI